MFELNSAGLNWPRGVMILDVLLVPLVVFWSIGHEEYLVSAALGAVFSAVADPGGSYGSRVSRLAVFALIGAGLTAAGFAIGGEAGGWLVLATFGVTLVASLTIMFGLHAAVAALLLNFQFIISLALAYNFHHKHHTSHTWAQVVAWAAGSTLWIALTFIWWLIHRRQDRPQPIAEMPGDTSRHPLTRPVLMYAVLRAAVIAGAGALAFGLNLSHGQWLIFGAFAAMKPRVGPTTVTSTQRLIGALIGAGAAALLLLIPANEHGKTLVSITHGLQVVAIVLMMHAVATFFYNYAIFQAAFVAAVLILVDLLQPGNYGAEGYRLLWTLCGVAMATVVMALAALLARSAAEGPPQPAQQAA